MIKDNVGSTLVFFLFIYFAYNIMDGVADVRPGP